MNKNKQSKELKLNTKDKKLAGVAGGIANYYNADSALIRVAAVVLVILTGILPGIIIYSVFYLLMKNTDFRK